MRSSGKGVWGAVMATDLFLDSYEYKRAGEKNFLVEGNLGVMQSWQGVKCCCFIWYSQNTKQSFFVFSPLSFLHAYDMLWTMWPNTHESSMQMLICETQCSSNDTDNMFDPIVSQSEKLPFSLLSSMRIWLKIARLWVCYFWWRNRGGIHQWNSFWRLGFKFGLHHEKDSFCLKI